ncbi:MAG: hypothetical protein KIT09_01705 [Bryobacteraceae bacterium]|nr:hypothetical protein [Bryobacteraceae bacterium]
MAAYITALTQSQQSNGQYAAPKADGAADAGINKEMFLKLLVAQLRNQDPLQPQDGVEFLSQLAQFANLEQMMAIRAELEAIHANLTPSGSAGETGNGGGS